MFILPIHAAVNVSTSLALEPERAYIYDLYFKFLPREVYKDDYSVRPKRIIKYMHQTYFKQLIRAILKVSNAKKTSKMYVVLEYIYYNYKSQYSCNTALWLMRKRRLETNRMRTTIKS